MTKRVKGGKIKHYCDKCGALMYDEIPQPPTLKFMGVYIPEVKIKRYKKSVIIKASRAKGTKAGECCADCAND